MINLDKKNREEISLLLPWYAAGTLEAEEQAMVKSALDADVSLREELQLVQEDRDTTLELIEEDDARVPTSMYARFSASLENQVGNIEPEAKLNTADAAGKTSLFERLFGDVFSRGGLTYAAIAAALVVVLQAGVIVSLLNNNVSTPARYETASGKKTIESKGLIVLVRFAKTATIGAVSTYLEKNGGAITEGPLPGGMYRLRFSPEFAADTSELVKKIGEKQDLFDLVLPVK